MGAGVAGPGRMTVHITIAGVGLHGAEHMSREAEDAVRGARVVFTSTYNAGIDAHVRALAPHAELRSSDAHEYAMGAYRPEMYLRMASEVLAAARDAPGVVMLAPGSALVVDRVTELVVRGAREARLAVRVLPGISSIETVLAQLRYDASRGLSIVLAQRLVAERVVLDPTRAALVLQPAYYDTLFFAGAPASCPGRYDALAAQLARTWSAEAVMALVATPTAMDARARVFWFRSGELGRVARLISPRHTLFVPPERAATIDERFVARTRTWDALEIERDARGEPVAQRRVEVPEDLAEESRELARRWEAREM